jgi:hypothetical protein
MKKKEYLRTVYEEKSKVKTIHIFFAFISKAALALQEQKFDSTIRLINMAYEKYLKLFHPSCMTYKKGEELINHLKSQITNIVLLIHLFRLKRN